MYIEIRVQWIYKNVSSGSDCISSVVTVTLMFRILTDTSCNLLDVSSGSGPAFCIGVICECLLCREGCESCKEVPGTLY